jgi:alanine racemase
VQPHKQTIVGVCTHFANVEDVLEHEYADEQIGLFHKVCDVFRQHGLQCIEHCASSASDLILAASRFGMCRVGIALYGFWPSPSTRLSYLQIHKKIPELIPALTWKTSIAMLKDVPAGTFIGYGCTFKAVKDMTVAVLPMGYYEGYPRLVGDEQSYVLIRGQRCPLVGRISMNLMVVDVSHVIDVQRYDEVILIGKSGKEEIDATKLAGWASTIHYELVTRIHPELPRRLV